MTRLVVLAAVLLAGAAARAQETQPASAPAPPPASQAALDTLRGELETLKEELAQLATKEDLKKYQRKPDEKEVKNRSTQELEIRFAFTGVREDEIRRAVDNLVLLTSLPGASADTPALAERLVGVADSLIRNDNQLRPRLTLRLYWETNRFLDERDFLFASVEPELMFFVFNEDLDRSLLPRDVAHPRDRFAMIIKKAAIGAQIGRVGLSAGVLQLTYGAGFFLNPTNPFTPKNPLDPRKEVDGIPAAKLDLSILQREGITLTAQVVGVADVVRNDVLGQHRDDLSWGGLAMVRADTQILSLTGIGIYQRPNSLGQEGAAFGGILSAAPLGLTTSVEALFEKDFYGGDYRPELIASIQGFTSSIGANGTTYVLEYYLNAHAPTSTEAANNDLARAVRDGHALYAVDRLSRPLGRRQYLNIYVEPSLSQRLRVNASGLIGLDSLIDGDGFGALVRVGFDYEMKNITIHAFGGATLGTRSAELGHHLVGTFAELAITASI